MPRFCAACGGQMADNAAACPACGKAAGQSAGGGAAVAPAQSSGGLTDNVAAGISYIIGILAIVFLLIDPYKNSKFVRFHCFQVITLLVTWIAGGIGFFVLALVGSVIHIGWLFALLAPFFYLALAVLGIVACVKAFQNQMWRIPVLGNFAAKFAGV